MFKPHLLLALAAVGPIWGLSAVVSGCSTYRVTVNQGNVIEEERLAQVEPGMTPVQVEYLLGTPLVRSAIAPDRWGYVLHIRRGEEKLRERRVTVYFDSGVVARVEDTDPRHRPAKPAADASASEAVTG